MCPFDTGATFITQPNFPGQTNRKIHQTKSVPKIDANGARFARPQRESKSRKKPGYRRVGGWADGWQTAGVGRQREIVSLNTKFKIDVYYPRWPQAQLQ